VARKLTQKELQQTKADFDPPKKSKRQRKTTLIKDMERAATLVEIKMDARKCPGRPRKHAESRNITFRLPPETIRKLRVKAALEERSPADIIVELVEALGVPGCV